MINRYQSSLMISNIVGWDVFKYLNNDIKKLLYDWKVLDDLIENIKSEVSFYDYSFIISPMYKAVEGTLWKIAKDLKLIKKGVQLGSFFDEDNIETIMPRITYRIKDPKKQKEVKNELHQIKGFLIRYRHNPAHFGNIMINIDDARLAANASIHNIKCLINDLLLAKLIYLPKETTQVINSDTEIPF